MKRSSAEWQANANARAPEKYELRLFVSGATPRSTLAIDNIKAIVEAHLKGRYTLEIVDAFQQQKLVRDQQIVALPTLVKNLPPPLRRIVGDMSDEEKVLVGLGLFPSEDAPG
jgi:circadian clock protein KaiB